MKRLLKLNYRNYICIGITFIFLLFAVFYFKYAYLRIFESLIDLWTSFKFYINELFELNMTGKITVNDFSKQPFKMPFNLPNTWDEFKILWSNYWRLFISVDNIQLYLVSLLDILYYISKFILIIAPLLLILLLFRIFKKNINNCYNCDTKSLIFFKKIEKKFYFPIKLWILDFIRFLKDNPFYFKLWFLIWAYNFNFIAIIIEFIAYYLFFFASFKLITIYIQVLKLLFDLSVVIEFIPTSGWFMIIIIVMNIIRKNIGYDNLQHMELKDRGFINERPIVTMVVGTMGKKKTTIITDMALSEEIMLRDKAFEKILETDLKFPFFPWINLENNLKKAIDNHLVYNLATCKKYINHLKVCFNIYYTCNDKALSKCIKRHLKKAFDLNYENLIFDYDFERYGVTYNDNLKLTNIWESIEVYCQLYFVYIIQSSLLISNYSIRTDNILDDLGNFPLWNTELFKKDSRYIESYSRHAHILDFDSLRLGKKVIENNPNSDSFEFGVIIITEIGKERGNNLELQHIKKNDETTNQKNDLFNYKLKMIRHAGIIDNFEFVKIIVDEQRPESWGADARDLCEIVHIDECSDLNLAMPLFAIEDLIIQTVVNKFSNRYYKHRFERGDNTLPMYLYHGLVSKLNAYQKRIYNTFGYYKVKVQIEKGTQDEHKKENNYYLMCKKIYSKRFSTDCFSDFFNEKALRSKLGLDDLIEFKSVKASFEELALENSYFFNELKKLN